MQDGRATPRNMPQQLPRRDSTISNNSLKAQKEQRTLDLFSQFSPSDFVLPPQLPEDANKKTLVLDLDETLVHSSFKVWPIYSFSVLVWILFCLLKPVARADYVIPVTVSNNTLLIYVAKRPGVDMFLQRMGELFEVVVFTASMRDYASPLLDLLDPMRVVRHRLYREHCVSVNGTYVKDLSRLGRPLRNVCLIDNSLNCGLFQPQNTIGIGAWYQDLTDTDLPMLIPLLERMAEVPSVEEFLAGV